ncbi:MAG TPA: SMI1/KNR4 family protein [Pyrinomonadaceae bacterium]
MLFISNMQRLKNHWISRGVKFNDGVSENALAAFEHKFGMALPADMREFFLTANGMPDEVTDDEMIRFWMLEEVKPLPSGAPEFATTAYVDHPESLFLFADYSLWAHAYAIRLVTPEVNRNEVFIIGGDYPILLFRSFSELVDTYLADKSFMFPLRQKSDGGIPHS